MADEYDYWLSFRIEDARSADGRSYSDRYEALKAAYNRAASMKWEETTSFVMIRSTSEIDTIATSFKRAVDPERDMVLMRRLDQATARIVGVFYDGDLLKFLPYLKKL